MFVSFLCFDVSDVDSLFMKLFLLVLFLFVVRLFVSVRVDVGIDNITMLVLSIFFYISWRKSTGTWVFVVGIFLLLLVIQFKKNLGIISVCLDQERSLRGYVKTPLDSFSEGESPIFWEPKEPKKVVIWESKTPL